MAGAGGGSEGDLDEPRLGDARFRLAFAADGDGRRPTAGATQDGQLGGLRDQKYPDDVESVMRFFACAARGARRQFIATMMLR